MYKIIESLAMKYNKLEEKMEQLQKWVDKKKKKINIIEWLNENDKIKPSYTFNSIFDKLNITQTTVDFLFSNSFYDTVNEILSNYYNNHNNYNNYNNNCNPENNAIPLFAFNQKANLIYVFNKNTIIEQSSWKELSKDELVDFLDKLQTKISKCLKAWKNINEDKVRNDNKYSELYSKTIIKIMDVKFNNETTITKYKSLLYNKIKVDMKNLIEYEYEF
jgi:predicted transcriptional regulator